MSMNRRMFLKSSAVAGGSAALASLGGCAMLGQGGPKVVVVGGGYGGATAARYIRMWGPQIEVTLIERDAAFFSCPLSNLGLGGSPTMEGIPLTYHALRDKHGGQ